MNLLGRFDSPSGGETDDTTGDTGSGISGGRGKFVTSETEIIGVLVADHGASDAGVRSPEHDLDIFEGVGGTSIGSSGHVTEITVVADFGSRSSVGLATGVVMRSSSLASLSEVT